MAEKKEKKDETPTRLVHANGAVAVVPAFKAEGLVASGSFSPEKKTSK